MNESRDRCAGLTGKPANTSSDRHTYIMYIGRSLLSFDDFVVHQGSVHKGGTVPLGLCIEDDQRYGATIGTTSSESGTTLKIADSKKCISAEKLEGCIIRETTVGLWL